MEVRPLSQLVESCWLGKLRGTYGNEVASVLEGTHLADPSEKLDFGLHVVRGAVKDSACEWGQQLKHMINMEFERSHRSVTVQGILHLGQQPYDTNSDLKSFEGS